jgi:hypothetical protein
MASDGTLDPQLAMMMSDLGGAISVVAYVPIAVMLAAVAAVWLRRCRTVGGRIPLAGVSRKVRRYSAAGASRSISPCSDSCITAIAVRSW